MCLYLRNAIEHIATSNIYVWKALVSGIDGYYSPVRSYKYNLGKTYKSPLDAYKTFVARGLHSMGYNVEISHTCTKEYDCFGNFCNHFVVYEPTNIIGLCVIPEGSHYYTDGYFYASDTLKFLRTLTINEFFNYMMNK